MLGVNTSGINVKHTCSPLVGQKEGKAEGEKEREKEELGEKEGPLTSGSRKKHRESWATWQHNTLACFLKGPLYKLQDEARMHRE